MRLGDEPERERIKMPTELERSGAAAGTRITSLPSFPPPNVSTVRDVKDWLEIAELLLKGSQRNWLAGRILTLLKHYYIDRKEPAALTRAIASDWIGALERYSPQAIDHACAEWLSRSAKKPKISNVAGLAAAWEQRVRHDMHRARLIISPPPEQDLPSHEEKKRLAACADLSRKYLEDRAERAVASGAGAEPIEHLPRKASPEARAGLRKAQLENRLMFPPESMSGAHKRDLAALRAWASGEAAIPAEFEADP